MAALHKHLTAWSESLGHREKAPWACMCACRSTCVSGGKTRKGFSSPLCTCHHETCGSPHRRNSHWFSPTDLMFPGDIYMFWYQLYRSSLTMASTSQMKFLLVFFWLSHTETHLSECFASLGMQSENKGWKKKRKQKQTQRRIIENCSIFLARQGCKPLLGIQPLCPHPLAVSPWCMGSSAHRQSWGMWLGLGPRGTFQRATKAKTPSSWCNDSPQTEHCGGYSELRLGFYVS